MSDINQQTMEALNSLREEVKSISPRQEVIDKCNKFLDIQEDVNQKEMQEKNALKAEVKELKESFASLEANLKRPNLGSEEKQKANEELKAFEKFLKMGKEFHYQPEKKYLRTDVSTGGGFLVHENYANSILEAIVEVSPVRQVARVETTTNAKSLIFTKETGLPVVYWIGEGQSNTASDPAFGEEEIFLKKLAFRIELTRELFDDASFDMKSVITRQIVKQVAKAEGTAFINGVGTLDPEGLMTNASVGFTASGNASTLGAGEALLRVQGDIVNPNAYNLSFMFNRKTLHQGIRTLRGTTNDNYLFQPALNGAAPNLVAGLPYALANDMPDIGANTFPIICGDFKEGYVIADNNNLRIIEDQYTQVGSDKLVYHVFKRTGGKVVRPEVLRKIKIST
jgi:HK97 family phage major capsid protein